MFGISMQALDFVRDGKIASQMKILKKVSFFDNTPSWKWFGPRNSARWKSLKKQIPSNFG